MTHASVTMSYTHVLVPHTATSPLPGTGPSANLVETWQFRITMEVTSQKNKQGVCSFWLSNKLPIMPAPLSPFFSIRTLFWIDVHHKPYGVDNGYTNKPTISIESKGTKTSNSKKHRWWTDEGGGQCHEVCLRPLCVCVLRGREWQQLNSILTKNGNQ